MSFNNIYKKLIYCGIIFAASVTSVFAQEISDSLENTETSEIEVVLENEDSTENSDSIENDNSSENALTSEITENETVAETEETEIAELEPAAENIENKTFELKNAAGFRFANDCIFAFQYERYFTQKFSMDFEFGFGSIILLGYIDAGFQAKYDLAQMVLSKNFANRIYVYAGAGYFGAYVFGENPSEGTAGFAGFGKLYENIGFGYELTIASNYAVFAQAGLTVNSETETWKTLLVPGFSAGFKYKF